MKQSTLMIFSAVLICLMAAGAVAQTTPPGDQVQRHNYDNVNGLDGNGGIHRHGDEFVGGGGPHGPIGPGPDDELLKFLGLDATSVLAGNMWIYGWGPGATQSGVEEPSPYGPNVTGAGFGPAGDMDGQGQSSNAGALNQARSGRR